MPEDPVARAVALHEQAIAARLEGRYHDGERACREATVIFEAIDGPQSADLAFALIEQGRLLDRLDRLAEAEAVLDRAVAILTPPARSSGDDDGDGIAEDDAALIRDELLRLLIGGELARVGVVRARASVRRASPSASSRRPRAEAA